MTVRALGGDVGARDFNSEIGVDHRYTRITGGLSDDDALATRHEHAQVGVRLEAGTGAADLDPMSFPVGAVAAPITITVTADQRYVAYKMEPTGTQFAKDVTVTQSLRTTSLYGEPLSAPLYGAYIADDNVKLSGNVPVLEIEPSKTLFSPLSALLPEAEVWVIRHFSRYMLASD